MANSHCPGSSGSAPGIARRATALVLAATLASGLCLPAYAAKAIDDSHGGEGWAHFFDITNPYASLEYAYDSNLLRLDDVTPSIDGRSDQYLTLGLGFASDIRVSQQRFVVSGEFSPRKYHSHDEYDYRGGNFSAVWHWTASDAWTGTAGYRYRRSLRDFANELSPKRLKDARNENRVLGSADYDLPGNWKAGVRGDFADITFGTTSALDLQRSSGGATMTYVSSAGNEAGLDLELVHGDYVNNSSANFDEYTIGPTLKWKFTVRTQLNATVGYTHRTNTGGIRPDYSGPTANIALTIADAGRGSLTATAYQKISNLSDEIPDYTTTDGVSLEPGWTLSNGMTVRLKGSYEHRDFRDASGSSARLDDVGALSGFLDWPLGRHCKLSAGVTTERRSSTRLYQDYEYLLQQIQIVGML